MPSSSESSPFHNAVFAETARDPVTGTLNREAILTTLFQETERVRRLRGSLSLVLLKIDDPGYWQSKFDPDTSNHLLRELMTRISRMLRSYDLLGRVSDDEFMLALPGCSVVHAAMMAERIRIEVLGKPFEIGAPKVENTQLIRMTASFGIASSRGRSPIVVLREAKQALDLALKAGPDSIRCAGEPLATCQLEAESTLSFQETES